MVSSLRIPNSSGFLNIALSYNTYSRFFCVCVVVPLLRLHTFLAFCFLLGLEVGLVGVLLAPRADVADVLLRDFA